MLYICIKFRENISNGFRDTERTLTKGHYSVTNIGFDLCLLSDNALYLYHLSGKYLELLKYNRANTIFILIITKGQNCIVVNICTSSGHFLYWYRVS